MEQQTYFDLIWDKYDHFVFDCDGVLLQHNQPIGNSLKVLNYLQETLHKSVYVLSNYGGGCAEDLATLFKTHSLNIPLENIYFSSYLTAKYIAKNYPTVKTVYYLGGKNVRNALEKFGFRAIGEEDNDLEITNYDSLIEKTASRGIDAVVVSYDNRFNAYKIYTSCVAISRGARFIATNKDPRYAAGGKFMPDTGAIASAIEITTGRQAEVPGKPSKFPFDVICEEHGIKDRKSILMIGDTVETDIMGAKAADIDACLVRSNAGVEGEKGAAKYVVPGVSVLSKGGKLQELL